MIFTTPVEMTSELPKLTQSDKLMLIGSCFAENMGERLFCAKFNCVTNPYGVLYNPSSIAQALREILAGKVYTEADLFSFNNRWHSNMHHSHFSGDTAEEALHLINDAVEDAHRQLLGLDTLLLTFGTAWVYEQEGHIVGNCHKQPERCFTRRRLGVDEITDDYRALFDQLLALRPALKVILTVSPIRHTRDGMHANALSKSTLLLAIDRLQALYPDHVYYFPAYELLLDELRDYRFYAADMKHPSDVAQAYVWQKFVESCFTPQAVEIADVCETLQKAIHHRPSHPQSEEYKRFLEQIMLKIDGLNRKYPYLDFQNEIEVCLTPLKP
ncbi:MAG: GSCFA domain-containing protein [Prevotellaceae bacterium]|jgi:hypothetical protein|nr:GSCFA domain-containing protein [Prevotellaceae bacterium]